MILSNVRQLRFEKGEREKRDLTYREMSEETGLSLGTLTRLMSREPLDRVDAKTLSTLCEYFGVSVGELLVYAPDEATATAPKGEQVAA